MQHVLFLQSPLGPFFKYLAKHFSSQGHRTYKINVNGGDTVYAWADKQFNYTGHANNWHDYLAGFIAQYKITDIVLYGDCRFYHKVAVQLAQSLNLKVWCFEEGYLRAGFITLEQGGCNGNSNLDVSLARIQQHKKKFVKSDMQVGPTFKKRCWYAIRYYVQLHRQKKRFCHYQHHRPWTSLQEGINWLKSFKQKMVSKLTDPFIARKLIRQHSKNLFLLPLQVRVDYQLRQHSPFSSVDEVIQKVIQSFANHANKHDVLVIKHHPQDRGFVNYQKLISKLIRFYNLEGRVYYLHELNLPKLYNHLKGLVTVNSTVGLSGLLHNVPTKVLGTALYDINGLTWQHDLDTFWQSEFQVDEKLFAKFHSYLQHHTQIPGDFYKQRDRLIARSYQQITQASEVTAETLKKIA
ncbi:capsular biosynthesis protein [Thalassotalea mangrovi]|uniref:Capsular biosynthesis protein n=2 Tax=Thalassotalea mangrovi TaxID=2572245 RepID=A0A4U1B869_9GAMM|nr:capsular biosynthesis protein [Thalassotalea mangrovi]